MVRYAISLIRTLTPEGWKWLAVWDARKKHFDFIAGFCLEDESARETIGREVSWRLNLQRGRDILVSNMAQANLERVEFESSDAELAGVRVEFFNVQLYRKKVVQQLKENPDVRWLDSGEICDGKTKIGLSFNPFVTKLINRSEVIQSWESFG